MSSGRQSWLFCVYFDPIGETLLNKSHRVWLLSAVMKVVWTATWILIPVIVILETLTLFPGNWLWKINRVAELMWKDFTHPGAQWWIDWRTEAAATCQCQIRSFPVFSVVAQHDCMELLSAIKACLNGPECAVACDGLKERWAVTVKMFNTSALIKLKQWKNKRTKLGVFCQRAISPFSHFLRVEDPVAAVVKLGGGNSCVFSCVWHVNTWLGKSSDCTAVLGTWNFPQRNYSSALPTVSSLRSHSHLLYYLCCNTLNLRCDYILFALRGFTLKHHICGSAPTPTGFVSLSGRYSCTAVRLTVITRLS